MKLYFFLFILSFTSASLMAQDKVKWSAHYDAASSEIVIDAHIADGWHLYSQHVDEDAGPVATSFEFKSPGKLALIDSTSEPKPIQLYDENFESMLDFFKDQAQFRQKVKSQSNNMVEVTITFMVCNDTMCLPPVDHVIQVKIP